MSLLTTSTAADYVKQKTSIFSSSSNLSCSEIHGGNLNYAFVVTDATTTPPTSVFVKQAPDFIKCLGESAKLHKERLLLEVRAYSEWLTLSPSLSPNMPTIFHTDSKNCVVVMEFLGDCELFEHELTTTPLSQPLLTNAASGLGAFLGKIHSKTHVTQLPQAVSDEYAASFKNESLRGVQMEYVFGKLVTEEAGEKGKVLANDEEFLKGLEEIKAMYMGGDAQNLALCHGDFHPGSIMASKNGERVVAIDPEFVVYSAPGVDLGSLLSGVVLAAAHHKGGGGEAGAGAREKKMLGVFVAELLGGYRKCAADGSLASEIVEKIIVDSLGFAACEVGRTALGFAGGRKWLQFENLEGREKAVERVVEIARRLMVERAGGEKVLLELLI